MGKTVWTFTNKRELDKSGFIDYFERKVFRTIRKYEMLPSDKIVRLKNDGSLNYNVLKHIISKKFSVEDSDSANILNDNLSEVAEVTFKNILQGKFEGPMQENRPLYYLSDKEVELYAKLVGIEGKRRESEERIQKLLEKFIAKNQDTEVNIVKALSQIRD